MFNSLKNYIKYRKIIRENSNIIKNDFNLKIDDLYRLGTIVKIPNEKLDVYREYKYPVVELHKSLDDEVKKYISKLDKFLIEKGLVEYLKIETIDQINTESVVIIISYKLYDIISLANIIRFIMIISLLSLSLWFVSPMLIIPGISLFLLMMLFNFIIFKKIII